MLTYQVESFCECVGTLCGNGFSLRNAACLFRAAALAATQARRHTEAGSRSMALSTSKFSHAHRVHPSPDAELSISLSRFVSTEGLTLAELLSADADGKLVGYSSAFEAAGIDVAMAATMQLADLREFLPQAPIAHCLLLKQRLTAYSPTFKPHIPDTASWKWPARIIANGAIEHSLKETAIIHHEFDLIAGSLLLSFTIGPLLAPPDSCAQGAACPSLLAVDVLLWATLTALLLLCVVSSWSMAAIEWAVSERSMAQWMQDNWAYYNLGSSLFVLSMTFLPMALSTRATIVLYDNPAYPRWLVWLVIAIITGGGAVLQYVWWVLITTKTFGVRRRPLDFAKFNLGLLGARLPTRDLLDAAPQNPVPYAAQ
jgi:hypothetical protein